MHLARHDVEVVALIRVVVLRLEHFLHPFAVRDLSQRLRELAQVPLTDARLLVVSVTSAVICRSQI